MSVLALAFASLPLLPQAAIQQVVAVPLVSDQTVLADAMGTDVAMEFPYLVSSAEGDGTVAFRNGKVYVVDVESGTLVTSFTCPNPASNRRFGNSLALDAGRLLVTDSEDAYLFDVATGQLLQTLPSPVASSGGWYVSDLEGSRAVVGALVNFATGQAHLYDVTTNTEVATLTRPGPPVGSATKFGEAVTLDATRCFVGAPDEDHVYVFSATDGTFLQQLPRPTLATHGFPLANSRFGSAIASEGAWVVVGAPGASITGSTQGSVVVYDAATLTIQYTLQQSDPAIGDYLGWELEIEDGLLFTSAPTKNNRRGRVYVFDLATGTELHNLRPQSGPSIELGTRLAVQGDRIVSGYALDNIGGWATGAARYFELPGAMTSTTSSISLSAGGSQTMALSTGPSQAGNTYLVLGSLTGTSPGTPAGAGALAPVVPLVLDGYTTITLNTLGSGAPLVNQVGTLDATGSATATFLVPPGSPAGLAGTTLHHAFVVFDPTPLPGQRALDRADGTLSVTLVP